MNVLSQATDVSDPSNAETGRLLDGKTIEEATSNVADPVAVLLAAGIVPASKTDLVNVLSAVPGYPHDKVEGLTVVDNFTIAVSNDDDFGGPTPAREGWLPSS
jgi:hypothetical protein